MRSRERVSAERKKERINSLFSSLFLSSKDNSSTTQVGERIEYEVPKHPEGKQHVSSYDFILNDLLEGKSSFFLLPF